MSASWFFKANVMQCILKVTFDFLIALRVSTGETNATWEDCLPQH